MYGDHLPCPAVNNVSFCLGAGVYTGPAGGRDGTPKKKPVKTSPSSESTVPPVPMLRGKEKEGNSDLDHPGQPQNREGCGKEALVCTSLPGSLLNKCFCVGVGVL